MIEKPELTAKFDALLSAFTELAEEYQQMGQKKFSREEWESFWYHRGLVVDSIILLGREAGAFDPDDALVKFADARRKVRTLLV